MPCLGRLYIPRAPGAAHWGPRTGGLASACLPLPRGPCRGDSSCSTADAAGDPLDPLDLLELLDLLDLLRAPPSHRLMRLRALCKFSLQPSQGRCEAPGSPAD